MRERGSLPNRIDPKHLERFRSTLERFAPVPDGDWTAAIPRLAHVTIPKGGYFLREGDVPGKLAFIAAGLFRVYFITDRGDERVMAFREEGRLISGFSPFPAERRPRFSIQALEDSELLQTPLDPEAVRGSADCWRQVYVKYMELLFLEKEERERQFLSDDAESRYRAFLKRHPGLEARVPQYEIASYLGITPVALSRIRKGMQAKQANS
ncbi:MAG TPA: Crp/Fnr family transcriptional regulator [Treponemataceae bacterium]|jgi:CRP-like cAMP-binding protein|nr:Crp/Fnr family transcriptional regulator [Treponemataceae bacterium]